jgi:hypothetical protein
MSEVAVCIDKKIHIIHHNDQSRHYGEHDRITTVLPCDGSCGEDAMPEEVAQQFFAELSEDLRKALHVG